MTPEIKELTEQGYELYVGLMSGTSIDGIDGVLVALKRNKEGTLFIKTLAKYMDEWAERDHKLLNGLCEPKSSYNRVFHLGVGGNRVATAEAKMVKRLLKQAKVKACDVVAVGAHGQTIWHEPKNHFSLQIDNGPLLANSTNIDAVVNFRAADLANGGQGAPLTQAFHQIIFSHPTKTRVVLNLGGIANISVLAPQGKLITAFDTGPANTLIDYLSQVFFRAPYDFQGLTARSGTINQEWLKIFLADEYFKLPYPKSTGREYFDPYFIIKKLGYRSGGEMSLMGQEQLTNLLTTVTELTAITVIDALNSVLNDEQYQDLFVDSERELVVCGGGAYNNYLLERMQNHADKLGLKLSVLKGQEFGVDVNFLEAQAFAFFAYCCVHGESLELGSSTGAKRPSILGTICPAPNGHYERMAKRFYEKN